MGPRGFWEVRLPDFMTSELEGGRLPYASAVFAPKSILILILRS
jgi:hypothetical protein